MRDRETALRSPPLLALHSLPLSTLHCILCYAHMYFFQFSQLPLSTLLQLLLLSPPSLCPWFYCEPSLLISYLPLLIPPPLFWLSFHRLRRLQRSWQFPAACSSSLPSSSLLFLLLSPPSSLFSFLSCVTLPRSPSEVLLPPSLSLSFSGSCLPPLPALCSVCQLPSGTSFSPWPWTCWTVRWHTTLPLVSL